jgi:hypothetical protein
MFASVAGDSVGKDGCDVKEGKGTGDVPVADDAQDDSIAVRMMSNIQ